MKRLQAVAFGHLGACLILLCGIALPTIVLAGEKQKQYAVEGIVTALGTTQETTGGDKSPVMTHQRRTYTVKTSNRLFVLECPHTLDSLIPPHECGGKKKIALGDTIYFRVEKRYAYVLTANGKEEGLAVLSEAMNEENAQATKP